MSASDCWELGHQSFMSNMYDHAATWFREALKRQSLDEDDVPNTFVYDTLSYLTDAHDKKRKKKFRYQLIINILLKLSFPICFQRISKQP